MSSAVTIQGKDSNNKPKYIKTDANGNLQTSAVSSTGVAQGITQEGASLVADVGITSQRHNRTNNVITATWPGNDTFSVSWTQAEDVRRYRILVTGGADGDHVRVVEDAVNEAQEEAWLTEDLNSTSADVEYLKVYTSTPDVNGTFIQQWSAWQELSKDDADLSLSRLGFIASAAGPFSITIEAE